MKEIIIVTNSLVFGGTERVLSELMCEWVHLGYKVTVIQIRALSSGETYQIEDDIEVLNIETTASRRLGQRLTQGPQIVRILRERKDATVLAMVNSTILLIGVVDLVN